MRSPRSRPSTAPPMRSASPRVMACCRASSRPADCLRRSQSAPPTASSGCLSAPRSPGGSSCASERPPPSPATCLATACSSSASPPCARRPATGRSARSRSISSRDVLDGVAAIWAHGGIKAILMLLLFGDGLYGAVRQMAPAFADRALGAGVGGLSTLLASAGVGATIAALWLAHGGVARASPATILWGFLGFVAAVSGLMLSRTHRRGCARHGRARGLLRSSAERARWRCCSFPCRTPCGAAS